jgi:hypothetical protein
MNDLDLPPRSTLPPETHDRIWARVNTETPRSRYKAPLSVAAAVAVLAAGAIIVGEPTGTSDGYRAGTTPPPSVTTVPGSDPQLTVTEPNAQSEEDLDHCWAAVTASQREDEFALREDWRPVFTVIRARPLGLGGLVRVTAFREPGGKPGFCEINEVMRQDENFQPAPSTWMATVSDPGAEPISLATGGGADVQGLFYSTGLLAGVANGVDSVRFGLTNLHPDTGVPVSSTPPPLFRDGLFLVEIGGLHVGSEVAATGLNGDGDEVASGEWPYDPAKDPLVGPSTHY